MNRRQVWLERIQAGEREYKVARIAARTLEKALRANPSLLSAARLTLVDFRALRDNLEATYLVRMFAAFEAGLRHVWKHARKRTTTLGMEQLINSLTSWKRIDA